MEFYWRAVYYEGSMAEQYDAQGDKVIRGYEDIDRQRLMAFEIREKITKALVHRVYMGPDKRLIWRMRHDRSSKDNFAGDTIVHLVGWQKTVEGHNVQAITCVFPDGHTELIDRWHEQHPWFYSVNLLDEEE